MHAIHKSLESDSACPLYQSRPRGVCLQRIQYRYGCGNLGNSNARALELGDSEETKAANNLPFPPGWLVRLMNMSLSSSRLI